MKTIYIDVYFLINFTVDLLAIYFSAVLSKINYSLRRMIFAAIIGGSYAVIFILLFEESLIMYPISLIILFIIVFLVCKGVSLYRKLKYAISFILFQLLIGGIVYYGYCALNNLVTEQTVNKLGDNNKKLLIFAMLVLLAMGGIKLFLAFFLNVKSETMITVEVFLGNKHKRFDALVDSGNLARDPFDKKPIMLIVLKEIRELIMLPQNVEDYDKLTDDLKRKIRIIPITRGNECKILYGIKPDKICVIKGKRIDRIDVTLAFDTEEKDFGGYPALIPLSCLEDIL